MEPTKVRVTVLLAPEVHMNLKIKSAQLRITMNDIMSDALMLYLQGTVDTEGSDYCR